MPEPKTSRERRHLRNQEEILRVAQDLILEVGPEAFSLREVARRADYAPSALYKYYAGKEELIGAVAAEALKVLGSCMTSVPTDLPPNERVARLADSYMAYAREYPRHFVLVFGRLAPSVPDWQTYVAFAWPFTILVDAFRDGVKQGVFVVRPGFGPAEMALGAWSLVHGAARLLQDHLSGITTDLGPAVDGACRAYVRGLMTDGVRTSEEER